METSRSICTQQHYNHFMPLYPAQPEWVGTRTLRNIKGKGKGLDTCYSATYMSQTRDQQYFTISEVAADWHEPMVPRHIMWPSTARANGQLDPRCS